MLALILIGIGFQLSGKAINWGAYLSMILFYGIVFFLGAYAARRFKSDNIDGVMLAGRTLPLGIAIFTMSATWVGGGYINGTAEYTASAGLVWVQAPWGYALSLILGGLFFAGKMRRFGFKTMLDPLHQRYGQRMAAVLYIPALTGEIFWTAAILTALGTTFGTVIGLDNTTAILISAFIAIAYTALGGLWAVALTDLFQMAILLFGLFLVIPFALEKVGGWDVVSEAYNLKMGAAASLFPSREALGSYYWQWWDFALLLIFGGIPWQVYFQRVLAAKNAKVAVRLSILAGLVCLVAAIPPVIIGMIGGVADWSSFGVAPPPDAATTLPWVVRHLTNPIVATIGLGAIAAAVMSSVDSSILSASSMTAWNIYRPLIKPKSSPDHLQKIIRRCIWIVGITALLLALNINSVYELWFLCSDFVYCLLFPALACALFDPKANRIGVITGFSVAFILRFGGGDATLGIPILLPYPMIEDGVVLFPFRTLAMVSGLTSMLVVSRLTQQLSPPIPLQKMA
ncbi:MAG: sodium:solute symporter [Saprospiraceae bacterium]|nr:MAG: sodium:solute symporter [Saprospiraceae bacterium]